MLRVEECHNMIETGCGAGHLLPYMLNLKKDVCHYTGTDISENLLSVAAWRLKNFIENPYK